MVCIRFWFNQRAVIKPREVRNQWGSIKYRTIYIKNQSSNQKQHANNEQPAIKEQSANPNQSDIFREFSNKVVTDPLKEDKCPSEESKNCTNENPNENPQYKGGS